MHKYYNLIIQNPKEPEILMGMLYSHSDFESIEEQEDLIIVSYNVDSMTKSDLKSILSQIDDNLKYEIVDIEDKNWNEEYEKSYPPLVILNGKWAVKASFHKGVNAQNIITINPKMSFGTGHHATTESMMTLMDKSNWNNKRVFDYGSGTGILAFMASIMGAKDVIAIDNEEWAYNNSLENSQLNNINNVKFYHSDLENTFDKNIINLKSDKFDVILANITKNILIASIQNLDRIMKNDSVIYLSGFYQDDISDVLSGFQEYNYSLDDQMIKDSWACLKLIKK